MLSRSPRSGPEIACSTSMASSTPRVMGPSLSRDQHSVMAPVRGTRPKVGRRPVIPQRILGATMLPPVSLPSAKPTNPAAVRARAGARAGGAFLQQPRVHRLSAEPDIVQSQGTHAEFGDEHRSGCVQSFYDRSVIRRNAVAVRLGAVGCRNTFGIEQVFCAPGNSMQRSAIFSGCDFL